MKRINSINEIDFNPMLHGKENVFVLPNCVLLSITKWNTNKGDKFDIRVTNGNYDKTDFDGKSYGNNYEELSWFITNPHGNLLQYWVELSTKIN